MPPLSAYYRAWAPPPTLVDGAAKITVVRNLGPAVPETFQGRGGELHERGIEDGGVNCAREAFSYVLLFNINISPIRTSEIWHKTSEIWQRAARALCLAPLP